MHFFRLIVIIIGISLMAFWGYDYSTRTAANIMTTSKIKVEAEQLEAIIPKKIDTSGWNNYGKTELENKKKLGKLNAQLNQLYNEKSYITNKTLIYEGITLISIILLLFSPTLISKKEKVMAE